MPAGGRHQARVRQGPGSLDGPRSQQRALRSSRANFNRFWNRRCDAAKVRRITVHDARRTCGSLLADLDVHPRFAMQILRHGRFSITMEIYTQVSSKATRDALKKLGESLDR